MCGAVELSNDQKIINTDHKCEYEYETNLFKCLFVSIHIRKSFTQYGFYVHEDNARKHSSFVSVRTPAVLIGETVIQAKKGKYFQLDFNSSVDTGCGRRPSAPTD